MKEAQAAVKELQMDADEAHASKGGAQQQAKDLEKKVRQRVNGLCTTPEILKVL